MKRRNYNLLFLVIVVLSIGLLGLSVAYAALSTSISTQFGTIRQSAMTWDVAFNTGTITGTASNSTVKCDKGNAQNTTISGMKVTFNAPGDKCSYAFQVRNNGTIGARISSITPKKPNSSCTTSVSTMVCGNITYRLRYNSATSTTQPAVGDVIAAKSGSTATTRIIYLTVEYTGATAATSDFSQSGFGYTINYAQN